MKRLASLFAALSFATPAMAQEAPTWSFAIHGGAGVIERAGLTPEQDAAYRAALNRALEAGAAVLSNGGTALDAVQAAIELMEDDPLFNAGRGAVFTAAGRNELDAAVMNGSDLTAGAVAGLTRTRHPIAAARAVMDRSPHVMLIGEGADTFAASVGLEQVDPSFFFTERRWQALELALRQRGDPIPARPQGAPAPGAMAEGPHVTLGLDPGVPLNERKFGTVGAVALDIHGNLAAGTSTGGMTGKRWGRVGDVPIIGAGTYASNAEGCAVSATGDGEYFIRATVARDICADMGEFYAAYDTIDRADLATCDADTVECVAITTNRHGKIYVPMTHSPGQGHAEAQIAEVGGLGGSGGVIVMNRDGHPTFAMNSSGMYRGAVSSTAPAEVAIYSDE
jgi:beta-aspartyl-peptidase (threonine type)